MVAPPAGAVVLVRFPFSDLSQAKLRPAVVLTDVTRGDRILCQITSKPYGDPAAIELDQSAFASGSLRVTSYARPGKLFTASQDLITSEVARLSSAALTLKEGKQAAHWTRLSCHRFRANEVRLAPAGRGSSDATPVWGDAPAHLDPARADGLTGDR